MNAKEVNLCHLNFSVFIFNLGFNSLLPSPSLPQDELECLLWNPRVSNLIMPGHQLSNQDTSQVGVAPIWETQLNNQSETCYRHLPHNSEQEVYKPMIKVNKIPLLFYPTYYNSSILFKLTLHHSKPPIN